MQEWLEMEEKQRQEKNNSDSLNVKKGNDKKEWKKKNGKKGLNERNYKKDCKGKKRNMSLK